MKINKKILNILLFISFLIIVFESMHSIYAVKSIDLYNEINSKLNISLDEYITIEMLKYFSTIVIFIIFSIYNYCIYDKLKINIMYKGVWSLFIISNILFKIFVFKSDSIFYYLSLITQIIMLIYILNLGKREE